MVEVSAPASSGNLGPGFDVLAVALELRCRVRAEPANLWSVRHHGPHAPARGEADAVIEAARMVAPDTAMHFEVFNDIPLTRGLGSSSAARAAGAAAAMQLRDGSIDKHRVFELVAHMEGHADNAAAAVYGGLVAAVGGSDFTPLEWSPELIPVVAIPEQALPTVEARAALPERIPLALAVRTLGRLVALVEGLRRGDAALLASAGGDELHEQPRAVLYPDAAALMTAARHGGALHACWSGAGPSVLAVTRTPDVARVVAELESALRGFGRVVALPVAVDGLR